MFLDTGNSFLASRIHFEHYFWPRGGNSGGKGGANFLSSKITILESFPIFMDTGNSFLASRIHFEDYFGQGVATVEEMGRQIFFPLK